MMQALSLAAPEAPRMSGGAAAVLPFISELAPAPADLEPALASMGLDAVEICTIAPDFRAPLVRLAGSWETAIAGSTLTSRRCDLRRFARWCAEEGKEPFVSDRLLAELMEAHVIMVGQTFSPGTAKRVGSNLTALAKGLGSDQAARGAQERRRLAVRAAQKLKRGRGIIHQKPRLTVAQMQSIRASIETSRSLPLRRLRDLAIFDIMCDLLARRSEVVGLRLPDLDLAVGTVRIAYSKTDQGGRGTVFQISNRTVASLEAWLDAAALDRIEGAEDARLPIFAAIMNDGKVRLGAEGAPEAMDGRTVARILQRYAGPLGIEGVAGHSLRRSMARALHEAGVPEQEITSKGRWSSLDQMRAYVGLTAPIQGAAELVF